MTRRNLAAVLLSALLLPSGAVTAAGNYRSVGSAAYQAFEVDVDSIERQGDVVRFRLRSTSTLPGTTLDYEGLIGVDCVRRTRAEYENMSSFNHKPAARRAGAGDMKTVFDGTRQALELDTVCALAHQQSRELAAAPAPTAPEPAAVPPPKPERVPTPRPNAAKTPASAVFDAPAAARAGAVFPTALRLYATSAAMLINPQGYLIVNNIVGGCTRVEVMLLGEPHGAEVVARDTKGYYALLRMMQGGPYPALARSTAAAAVGEPVTIIGFPAYAPADAVPVAAAGVVWGHEAAGTTSVVTTDTVAPASGVVLDRNGAVLGMVDGSKPVGSGQRKVTAVDEALFGGLLIPRGVNWAPGGTPTHAPTLSGALRHAVSATPLVACYTNR